MDVPPLPRHDAAVRALVRRYGWNATCYQTLNPGLSHWLEPDGDGAVGYVTATRWPHGRTRQWVAAGGPVCAAADVDRVAAAFEAEAARHGARVTWFGADERLCAVREGRPGWTTLSLGAQPVWTPAGLAARIQGKRSLRAQLHRARNKGLTVAPWTAARAEHAPALRHALAAWLARRGLPSLHFLVEPHTLDHLGDRRVFVAEAGGAVVGFAVLSPVPARRGWLVEQIVRVPGAPNGTSESLVQAAAEAVAGDAFLTLGLVPLASVGGAAGPPAWLRALFWWMRQHTRRFYDFEGLERFKAKFEPERWDPIVALTQEPRATLGTLHAVADAFAGARSPSRLVGRALADAAAEEARRLARRISRLEERRRAAPSSYSAGTGKPRSRSSASVRASRPRKAR